MSPTDFEWYLDFVDLSYMPDENDLIALFKVTPAEGMDIKDAAGRIASESSIGTWTTLTTMTLELRSLMAKAFKIDGNLVKIAYPIELFEPGNMPQMLSCFAGNIYGMRAVKYLRLLDLSIPLPILKSFKGPQFGIKGVRDLLKVYKRPITATVPKPKVGLTTEKYAEVAYEILSGGVDLLKDDENLGNLTFNKFEARLEAVMKVIDKVEKETGERKGYLINVTAETKEMLRRAKLVADYGNPFVMIDFVLAGWSGLLSLRELTEDLKLAIHAHRAFHAAFTRGEDHGMSMLVLAKLARVIGVDHIHIGAAVGKMETKRAEVINIQKVITQNKIEEDINNYVLSQDWYDVKPVTPVISGGLHPGLLPAVVELHGNDILIQVGGGVTGHPRGPKAGAKAVRQALDAIREGIPLREYAKKHKELDEALRKWGFVRPR